MIHSLPVMWMATLLVTFDDGDVDDRDDQDLHERDETIGIMRVAL